MMKHSLLKECCGALLLWAVAAPMTSAQTIEQGSLSAPTAFDAGLLNVNSGGLAPTLWSGTSARLATQLISQAPLESGDPLIKDMLRAVLLSSGIPPQGDADALKEYEAIKLKAIGVVADPQTLGVLVERSGSAARTPKLQAEFALRKANIEAACGLSDTITEGRSEIFWSRLRTLCHLQREELAAAELTTDLLRSQGYADEAYFMLINVLSGVARQLPEPDTLNDPINETLYDLARVKVDAPRPGQAFDAEVSPDLRMAALLTFMDDLSEDQIIAVFSELALDPNDILGSSILSLDRAEADLSARGTAQLFLLARAKGNPDTAVRAFSSLLKRLPDDATRQKLFLLAGNGGANWSADVMIASDVAFYAHAAVHNGDLALLQRLHKASFDDFAKSRIALAADALGNGFALETMGRDIDRRLAEANDNGGNDRDRNRAQRDALLALSLGAIMSETAMEVLPEANFGPNQTVSAGQRVVLEANGASPHTAQLILRLAALLDADTLDAPGLALAVRLLQEAGLQNYAGRLAARDFLAPLQSR